MMTVRLVCLMAACICIACGQDAVLQTQLHEGEQRPAMRLDDFTQLALRSNPALKQANALVQMAAGQARQAGLYPNPSVGYQGEEIRGGSYRGGKEGAYVQQTFVLGGKLGLRRNVYEQQRRTAAAGVEEQRSRLVSDVGQSFYAALAAQELVAVERRMVNLADDAVATARQLANVGQADAPDVLQAEVESEEAKADYFNAQGKFVGSFQSLSALAGQPQLPLCPLQGELERVPEIESNGITEKIARESPVVKRAQQDVLRAQAELKSTRREPIPDLQIHAGLQNNFEPLRDAGSSEVGVHAFVSAGINLPLFNRNTGNVAAAAADVARAQAEVLRVQFAVRQQIQPLVQDFSSNLARAKRYKAEVIPRAERAYRLYLEKYQQMGAAYPQVIVSQRTLFRLQANYIQVLETLWRDAISLQNYGLTSGLEMPAMTGEFRTDLNLPNASGGGSQ